MTIKHNITDLILKKLVCDNSHKNCVDIATNYKNDISNITQSYLNSYLMMIRQNNNNNTNNSCLSYNNKRCYDVRNFIVKVSEKIKITLWDSILINMTDEDLIKIIKNQINLDHNLIDYFINTDNINLFYGGKINFINYLISNNPTKYKTFELIINNMSLEQFIKYIGKMYASNIQAENILIKYIKNNSDLIISNEQYCNKLFSVFANKNNIIKNIYHILSTSISNLTKKTIFNYAIATNDRDIILLVIDDKENIIKPSLETVIKLVEKCHVRSENGYVKSNLIAEIIDLLIIHGLKVNKTVVIKLLEKGCYIDCIEKYGITIDEEILEKCANISYYPYKFNTKPTEKILIKECSKGDNNINTIKKLKEYGGIYTTECLIEACKIKKNGRIIKFLLSECNVKADDKCLIEFQKSYGIESLDLIIKNYSMNKEKKDIKPQTIKLNEDSVMSIDAKDDIKIDLTDEVKEYEIKNKVRKFFDLKKKSYKYNDLYEHILKYLVSNDLVIGNYFVINSKMSLFLKINHCTIMNIDELHNILTYFIDY